MLLALPLKNAALRLIAELRIRWPSKPANITDCSRSPPINRLRNGRTWVNKPSRHGVIRCFRAPPDLWPSRKVIVLFTDGEDNASTQNASQRSSELRPPAPGLHHRA